MTGIGGFGIPGLFGVNGNAYDDPNPLHEYVSDLQYMQTILQYAVEIFNANNIPAGNNDPNKQDARMIALYVLKHLVPIDSKTVDLMSQSVDELQKVSSDLHAARTDKAMEALRGSYKWLDPLLDSGKSALEIAATIDVAISSIQAIKAIQEGDISNATMDTKFDLLQAVSNIAVVATYLTAPGLDASLAAIDVAIEYGRCWSRVLNRGATYNNYVALSQGFGFDPTSLQSRGGGVFSPAKALFTPEDLEEAKKEFGGDYP
jgi:hypothetical protein